MHFFHTEKNHKIFFQDPNTTNAPKIEYDGVPYIIERRKVFDCQHGIDRNLADKNRYLQKSEVQEIYITIVITIFQTAQKKIAASCACAHLIGKKSLTVCCIL